MPSSWHFIDWHRQLASSLRILGLAAWLVLAAWAQAQTRPYIGFAYPAGGQQGTTFQVNVGGQGLDGVNQVFVTGQGVRAKVVEYHRRLGPQEMTLMREQLGELRKAAKQPADSPKSAEAAQALKARIERRIANYVNRPACASIANIAIIEITAAPNARPGPRELRLGTPTGVSNPLAFHIGNLPEISRKPMITCEVQVLGKEELALRNNLGEEAIVPLTIPCVVNGQTSSGEVDRYRFTARKGQQLVIAALARQLIPYIADAVPGWFQPVLTLQDPSGKEVAYVDDFRFKPDPILFYQVPADGEYVFSIRDSIYRGREDFVYRITVGELPYATSLFPLGGRLGDPATMTLKGVNLGALALKPPERNAEPGIHSLAETRDGSALNPMPFDVDTLPEAFEREPNNHPGDAQKVKLPITINGHVDNPGDWDVFQFSGHAGETIVAEVLARRLDSPLDATLKLTDAAGKLLALNDDRDDPGTGMNTHHADPYISLTLPADGTYYLHLGDTAQSGSDEHGYRLRISPPRPDFALRVVPSAVSIRNKSTASVNVHVFRKDGFTGPITVRLQEGPRGLSSSIVTLTGTQQIAQVTLRADWASIKEPLNLTPTIAGTARIENRTVTHEALPAEDRMQAFLWRHLVPATDLRVHVFDPAHKTPPKNLPVMSPALAVKAKAAAAAISTSETPPFTKKQVGGRLRDLKLLFEEGLLSNDFYILKVAECGAVP
ncbi:MAG: PPC domain-containing protein [Verrucomicrobia bacterium]|nr:PPC domain-containing protein [Verrucomicrobiota bacterium]